MTETPELEKMARVKESSHTIGEFIEGLFNSKNYHIARYLSEEEYESEGNVVWVEPILNEKGKPWKRHNVKKGELIPVHVDIEKLLAEYFEIDLEKAEKERREILKSVREKGGR